MERESFESEDIAKIMNDNFVCIKVDREEHPNVDRAYMTFVSLLGGHTGWPLNVFLTPNLKPFFGGTYFPPHETDRQVGWDSLLLQLANLWTTDPGKLVRSATSIFNAIASASSGIGRSGGGTPNLKATPAIHLFQELATSYDHVNGGFGSAPKFPTPVIFTFLKTFEDTMFSLNSNQIKPGLAVRHINDKVRAMGIEVDLENENELNEDLAVLLADEIKHVNEMAQIAKRIREFTLQKLTDGGIHDHIGGGFHRYSVDEKWHLPHFEKMCYDQGLLMSAFADSVDQFKTTVKDIVTYAREQMQHEEGGFFAAEDAESVPSKVHAEGQTSSQQGATEMKREGAFAVWEHQELLDILGDKNGQIFNYMFGVKTNGNVDSRHDHRGDLKHKNVLYIAHSLQNAAQHFRMSEEDVKIVIESSKEKLREHRFQKRPKPSLDDKIIASWNGLMVSGLAKAALLLEDQDALTAATETARFIKNCLVYVESGPSSSSDVDEEARPQLKRLGRYWKDGERLGHGECSDYCNVIMGLLDLYRVSLAPEWLHLAIELQDTQDKFFFDAEQGDYYCTEKPGHEGLRLKEEQDGAEPSPSAVSVSNLIKLSVLAPGKDQGNRYRDIARRVISEMYETLEVTPRISPLQCANLMTFLGAGPHLALVYGRKQHINPYLRLLREHDVCPLFITPSSDIDANNVLSVEDKRAAEKKLEEINEVVGDIRSRPLSEGTCEVWLCEKGACGLPIRNLDSLAEELKKKYCPV